MLLVLSLAILLLISCDSADVNGNAPQQASVEIESQLDTANETDIHQDPADEHSAGEPAVAKEREGDAQVGDVPIAHQAEPAMQVLRSALTEADHRTFALEVIARLPSDVGRLFASEVAELAAEQEEPGRHLLAAWLASDPEAAEPYLAEGIAAGREECLMALAHDEEAGKRLMSAVEIPPDETDSAKLWLDLLRIWGAARTSDEQLLRQLEESDDVSVACRAAGHLLAAGAGGDPERMLLETVLRERGGGWIGAVEGIRISGDAELADALVPLVSRAQLMDDPGQGQMDQVASDSTVLLGSYALSYLPGEQAALMRRKLLSAADLAVRWQALLGELLHGNPYPWHNAVARQGLAQQEMWVALEAPEAVHPELLPLYAACTYADDVVVRGRAARHMNRYNGIASDSRAARTLGRLARDDDSDVRIQAWMSAGDLRLGTLAAEAAAGLEPQGGAGPEQLARAYCVLAGGWNRESGAGEKGSDG